MTPLLDLQAERDRLIAALVDNDRQIDHLLYQGQARPNCPACRGTRKVPRPYGLVPCSCTRRDARGGQYGAVAPVKGDTR